MKQIRLSGREATVIRHIGFGLSVTGEELMENTRLAADDLTDVLNAMMDVGYVESTPFTEKVLLEAMPKTEFEVNSAYAHELKDALHMGRR